MPLRFPFGPPPRAPWKRQTVQPRTAGALHRSRVRFEVAEQRGAPAMSTTRPMVRAVGLARTQRITEERTAGPWANLSCSESSRGVAAWPAALRQPAPPATLAQRPALN
jgi:hypothetical protein